jgi:hypothetical protein
MVEAGLSGVRMLELARDDAEHPYRGGSSVWRAAVRRERLSLLHEQAVADVPIRFEGLPGEYLQVDWGEIRHFPFTQQQSVTRYFLAGTHSDEVAANGARLSELGRLRVPLGYSEPLKTK